MSQFVVAIFSDEAAASDSRRTSRLPSYAVAGAVAVISRSRFLRTGSDVFAVLGLIVVSSLTLTDIC